MQYTVGNWTVASSIVEASSDCNTLSIPAVTRAEYAARDNANGEIHLANITSAGFDSVPEIVRYGVSKVANVYNGTEVPNNAQMASKQGLRLLAEVKENFTATNAVSGTETIVPVRAWMVLQVPQSNLVTPDAADYVLKRLIGSVCMDWTSDTRLCGRFLSMARGDLDPSGSK